MSSWVTGLCRHGERFNFNATSRLRAKSPRENTENVVNHREHAMLRVLT